MKTDYWHKAWQAGRIGFHQSRINSRLERWWPELGIVQSACVFAPLCGKSLDLVWLHTRGHAVLGSELSPVAAHEFFAEQGWTVHPRTGPGAPSACRSQAHGGSLDAPGAQPEPAETLQVLSAADLQPPVTLLVGDYFALTAELTGQCQAFYDRAALVAMPPERQPAYVEQLARLSAPGSVGLLITLSYDTGKMQGPPFSTPDARVRSMTEPYFELELLEHSAGAQRLGNLRQRGLDTMEEHVYRLQRRPRDPIV